MHPGWRASCSWHATRRACPGGRRASEAEGDVACKCSSWKRLSCGSGAVCFQVSQPDSTHGSSDHEAASHSTPDKRRSSYSTTWAPWWARLLPPRVEQRYSASQSSKSAFVPSCRDAHTHTPSRKLDALSKAAASVSKGEADDSEAQNSWHASGWPTLELQA